jgi:hypothetical protein
MAYYRNKPVRFISNRAMTRAGTPALFGAPADTPACAMGTMCGAPEAEVEPEPEPVPVVQAGIMPAPGAWVWAGLGLVGGYVLHSMMKKGK